jgi:flagellar hook-basal body complex protein FliE
VTVNAVAPVANVVPLQPSAETRPEGAATPGAELDFEGLLRAAVERVNVADQHASRQVEALARGATDDLHGTMIAVKEAEIGVKLVGSIRNKLLDAFHEIWRTGV